MNRVRDMIERATDAGLGRMGWAGTIALVSSVILLLAFPHQLGVVLAALNKVALGGWLGYWFDRWAFPYARPHELTMTDAEAAGVRRAIIVAASMLGMALAV